MKFSLSIKNTQRGFTLIELMTSVSIFLIIMTISMGAIFNVFDVNRKSESLKIVMDNLNLSVESLSREMRFGRLFHCEIDPDAGGSFTSAQNCISGGKLVSFLSSEGDQITYRVKNNSLQKSLNGSAYLAVTAPEIIISNTGFNFYVTGAQNVSAGDFLQPKTLIKFRGKAGSSTNETDFSVQTVVSQRTLDNT